MASPAPGSSGGLDPLQIAVLAGAAAVGFALTLPGLVSSLHALQQDDYSAARFARWLGASKSRAIHWRLALIYVAATILHLSLAAGGTVPVPTWRRWWPRARRSSAPSDRH